MVPLILAHNQIVEEKRPFRMVVTQPRREATRSLAERLDQLCNFEDDAARQRSAAQQPRGRGEERAGEYLHEDGQWDKPELVAGYRYRNNKVSDEKEPPVVFMTSNYFLQWVFNNPHLLRTFTHVVLDEIHERDLDLDFLAALLKILLSRPDLAQTKLLIMSATLDRAFL